MVLFKLVCVALEMSSQKPYPVFPVVSKPIWKFGKIFRKDFGSERFKAHFN